MKVFGTGWQRTGTTSLSKAFAALGLAAADFPKELLHDPDHEILRTHDAFTDNPIPLFYQQLDRRFPGAKFVHTEREEQAWLASCEWLFTVGRVKFDWDRHPIVAEIHTALYGTSEFDAPVFLERYRRHNREVRAYFAGRSQDLLILDITRGQGYELLCPFLGLPVPETPFPHWNRTESSWRVLARKIAKRFGG